MLNYQLSQKLKLIGRGKFNDLIISLTLPSCVGSNFLLIGKAQHVGHLIFNGVKLTESRFDPLTFGSREGYPLLINMPKVLSTGNVELFLNTLPHVQASIFYFYFLSLSRC